MSRDYKSQSDAELLYEAERFNEHMDNGMKFEEAMKQAFKDLQTWKRRKLH